MNVADASTLREQVIQRGNDVFAEAQRMMVAELREAAPLGLTGETRRRIESIPGGTAQRPAATVRSTAKGGDFVEAGTPPHVIRPRNGRALRFPGGAGRISQAGPNQRIPTRSGGVVFAKVVHHPGTPARPWFRPVVERFGEILQRAAARVQ